MAPVLTGLLASSFVDIAKNTLVSAITDHANMLWNFGVDLEDMMDALETISAVLEDAERRAVKEKLVRLWLKRLKDVATDISDMFEDHHQDPSDQTTAKVQTEKYIKFLQMSGVLSCLVSYKNIALANRMKSLREKLTKIRNEIDSFHFIRGSSTTMEQPYDERETTSDLPEEPLIGRDGEKQEIINLLSANTSNDEIVIVAIYGLAGMGKSTLAQLVYNDAHFKKYDHRIWVYVSQDFNLNRIGNSIISQLPSQGGQQNLGIQQVINQCLEKLFHGKVVLVVLDDLWEEKQTELDKLRRMLYVKGSKVDIIVTTRKEEIARKLSTCEPYKLRPLDDAICWEIIKRSSRFELKSNQDKLKKIGLVIAKKCGGMGLAAQAIGFMLRNIDDISGWTKINSSGIWNNSSDDNEVLPSLKLSYQRMPPQLRICFSFCAIFPKGHNITKDNLVQQWVSLGFIEQSKGKDYFNTLLGMSFLQVSKLHSTSQEHVVQYNMHDLVYDLARLTMEDELIVFDVAPQRNTRAHKYCRYSLLRQYEPTMKLTNMPSKIRALRFSDCGKLLKLQSGAFSFGTFLRTLDFSECSGIVLPASIGRLKQLRCLIAPRMENDSLPECITELSKLQYLNINGSSKITKLPRSIGNLRCLQYLCMSGCSGISKLAESFGDLKCMVHLEMSHCSGLTELPQSLGNLTQLQYLNLSSCSYLEALPEGIGSLVGMQYLNMSGCAHIRGLPASMMKLQSLGHLNLSGCRRMRRGSLSCLDGLTALQHLDISHSRDSYHNDLLIDLPNLTNNLKYLSLSHCYTLRYFTSHQKDLLDDFIASLTDLKHLDFSRNFKLEYLPKSIGNLKRLHTLDLSYCSNLMCLPESIRTLGQLQSLLLDGCSDAVLDQASSLVNYSQTLPVFKVRVVVDDDSNGGSSNLHLLQGVHDDSNGGSSNLHLLQGVHVSELRIRCLENVRSLEEAENVRLSDKHNLSKLTLAWSTIHKRAVKSLEDQKLLEQLEPEDQKLLEQLEPPAGLKSMSLEGYNGTSFPGWLMDISDHLTNLVSIQLSDLPMCSNLPPLGQLQHLEKLSLWKLPGIKRIEGGLCGGKGAFPRLSSFSITWMEGLEEWNTTYYDEDGVEEFMFPELDHLEIQGCPRLRLKPCPPTFRECYINGSGQVISSLEEVHTKSSHHKKSSHHHKKSSHHKKRQAIKLNLDMVGAIQLDLDMMGDSCQSMRLFHHFPALRELRICGLQLKSVPESMRHLSCLESLTLQCCYSISALPEWLSDLSSLKSLVIFACHAIKSLPKCIQQFTKLQTLEISYCPELKKWCESKENKTKLAQISIVRLLDPLPSIWPSQEQFCDPPSHICL